MNKVRLYRVTAGLLVACCISTPAFAFPNKDMIQLQTQVQQLLDAVARLQQSNDERMGVLKDLVQQNADSVNRMSVAVDTLQKQITAQQAVQGGKIDQVSGQIQSLNDTIDEVKARMNRLEKALTDVSSQQQNLSQTIQSMPPPGVGSGAPQPLVPQQQAVPVNTPPPSQTAAVAIPAAPAPRKNSAASSVDDLYKTAFNDFMAARYTVASAEFQDVIKSYPDSPLAGNSYYYLGEIDYRAGKFSTSVKDYDKVIEQYPDNNKVPAAHLHKGQAYIEMRIPEAAAREYRALIQRFPNSPEAGQARTKLIALGSPLRPRG
jgi:tol-pal system protein YbgF